MQSTVPSNCYWTKLIALANFKPGLQNLGKKRRKIKYKLGNKRRELVRSSCATFECERMKEDYQCYIICDFYKFVLLYKYFNVYLMGKRDIANGLG